MALFQDESPCKRFFFIKMSFICVKMNLQMKRIFMTMASHEDRFDTEAEGNSEMHDLLCYKPFGS